MYFPTKKNNDQYPTILSFQFPLLNRLRNLEFVYLKPDFAYLIFPQGFIASRFFDNRDYYTIYFETLELILWKETPFMWN